MVLKECLYVSQEEGTEKQVTDGFEYTIIKTKRKKVTELIVGKQYKLQYSGQFCHFATTSKIDPSSYKNLRENLFENAKFTFVGRILDNAGGRNIFYASGTQTLNTTYVMFSCNNLDYVLEEV